MKLLITFILIGMVISTVSVSQRGGEEIKPTPTPTPTPEETRTPTPTPKEITTDSDIRKYLTLEEERKIEKEISEKGDFIILGINEEYNLLRYSDNSSVGLLFNYREAIR